SDPDFLVGVGDHSVTEPGFQHRSHGHGTAVNSPQHTGTLQGSEVTPHRFVGDVVLRGDLCHGHAPSTVHALSDDLLTFFRVHRPSLVCLHHSLHIQMWFSFRLHGVVYA